MCVPVVWWEKAWLGWGGDWRWRGTGSSGTHPGGRTKHLGGRPGGRSISVLVVTEYIKAGTAIANGICDLHVQSRRDSDYIKILLILPASMGFRRRARLPVTLLPFFSGLECGGRRDQAGAWKGRGKGPLGVKEKHHKITGGTLVFGHSSEQGQQIELAFRGNLLTPALLISLLASPCLISWRNYLQLIN